MRAAMMGGVRKLLAACVLFAGPAALAGQVLDSSLRLTAEERYDDDFRLAEGTGGQFMTKLSPRLGLEMKDPRTKSEAFYSADLLIRHGSGNTSLDHRGGVDLGYQLSRRLKLDFTSRVFRVTDPTSLPREGVARSLSPTLYGQAKISVTERATQRLDLRASYSFEGAKVYEAGREPGYVHTPSLELWYRTTRRLSLGLEYRFQGFLFNNEFSDAQGVTAGMRYRLTRPTTLTVRGGPIYYTSPEGQSGWLPRAALGLERDGELFDLGVSVGHDLVGASGFTNALWADYASVMVSRTFDDRLSAHAAASYFRNGRAPGEGAFRWSESPDVSQGYAVGGSVDYRMTRDVTLQGAVDRIAQVGAGDVAAGVNLARNVLAVRLLISAW
jgi:hypothetical protein